MALKDVQKAPIKIHQIVLNYHDSHRNFTLFFIILFVSNLSSSLWIPKLFPSSLSIYLSADTPTIIFIKQFECLLKIIQLDFAHLLHFKNSIENIITNILYMIMVFFFCLWWMVLHVSLFCPVFNVSILSRYNTIKPHETI